MEEITPTCGKDSKRWSARQDFLYDIQLVASERIMLKDCSQDWEKCRLFISTITSWDECLLDFISDDRHSFFSNLSITQVSLLLRSLLISKIFIIILLHMQGSISTTWAEWCLESVLTMHSKYSNNFWRTADFIWQLETSRPSSGLWFKSVYSPLSYSVWRLDNLLPNDHVCRIWNMSGWFSSPNLPWHQHHLQLEARICKAYVWSGTWYNPITNFTIRQHSIYYNSLTQFCKALESLES